MTENKSDPETAISLKDDNPKVREKQLDTPEDLFATWKPNQAEWLMIACFMIVSLVVALDATILVPILPVSLL